MKLQTLIKQYLDYRTSLGWRACTESGYLGGFGRFVGADADVSDVRLEHVQAFLAGTGSLTSTWHTKYTTLRSFYRYAVSRGYAATAPLPSAVPKRPPRFVPYIYSVEELGRLVRATESVRRRSDCSLSPLTMRTLLILLYGAGLRIQEALNLNATDVDLTDGLLAIRQTKFGKTRLVPVGSQLRQALAAYSRGRVAEGDTPFFPSRNGGRIRREPVEDYFRALCQSEGIQRTDGASRQPRLHDLRHTFAVHRLTSWYRAGADVQNLLPHLSTYLGHVDIQSTQVYLSMTPELLDEAGNRFERYAQNGGRRG